MRRRRLTGPGGGQIPRYIGVQHIASAAAYLSGQPAAQYTAQSKGGGHDHQSGQYAACRYIPYPHDTLSHSHGRHLSLTAYETSVGIITGPAPWIAGCSGAWPPA